MEGLAREAARHEAAWLLLLLLLLLLHLRQQVLVHRRLLRSCVRLLLLLLRRCGRLHLLLLLLLLLEERGQLAGACTRPFGRADGVAAGCAAEAGAWRGLPGRHEVLLIAGSIAALRVSRGQQRHREGKLDGCSAALRRVR